MTTAVLENQAFSPSGAHQLDLAEFVSIGPDGWECFATECGITASCD